MNSWPCSRRSRRSSSPVPNLQLYLDTHPGDARALADYNAQAQRLAALKAEYAQRYGPLTHFDQEMAGYTWRWICEPWPWEINY